MRICDDHGGAFAPPFYLTMRRSFLSLLILLVSLALTLFAAAAASDDLNLLYFFSSDCPSCKNIEPIVKDLSREFKMQGLVYGEGRIESIPFEVRTGDEDTSKRYGVESFPVLTALMNGKVKQTFRGERDIRDVKPFLYAFRRGALSISEAVAQEQHKILTIAGWVIAKGAYFKNVQFFITDREADLSIKAWLPLEAVRSPFRKKRPRLMSDVVNRPVALRGELIKEGQIFRFWVKEEILLDEK